MPYYVGITKTGTVESLSKTLDPSEASGLYIQFEQISEPFKNPTFTNEGGFRERTIEEQQEIDKNIARQNALSRNIFSKLKIVEVCIELGIWSTIKSKIKENENMSDCWDACNEVNTQYGMTADFLNANLTSEQLNQIKIKIAGLEG